MVDALRHVPHQVVYTPDEHLPAGFSPARETKAVYVRNHLGAYRCFRGHQLALAGCQVPTLVLEDDAWPNREDWRHVVADAMTLLERFDVVSLHGRDIDAIGEEIQVGHSTFVTLRPTRRRRLWYRTTMRYVQGSLAYLVTPSAARRFTAMPYSGIPVDHLIANAFSFAVIVTSPFDHERRLGSLVERPGR